MKTTTSLPRIYSDQRGLFRCHLSKAKDPCISQTTSSNAQILHAKKTLRDDKQV